MEALVKTDFNFSGQTKVYKGKVRDVYDCGDKLVMVTSDRLSAFDVVLPMRKFKESGLKFRD